MKKIQPIANTACLVLACRKLKIPYTFYDDNHNLVAVSLSQEYFFANSSTPFNNESVGKIFKDKEFAYRVTSDAIKTPKTIGFIDPNCNPDYARFVKFTTHEEIIHHIEKNFRYPLILKMNSGSRGTNVFKCNSRSDVRKYLETIYDKSSLHYDYVALAQEYIKICQEFRVVIFQNEILFAYEKDFSQATLPEDRNISPLHQENSKALLVRSKNTIKKFTEFLSPLFKKMPIGFAGLDVVIDNKSKLWLIELNSKPGFEYFVRDNGNSELIKMYEKMLKFLK